MQGGRVGLVGINLFKKIIIILTKEVAIITNEVYDVEFYFILLGKK